MTLFSYNLNKIVEEELGVAKMCGLDSVSKQEAGPRDLQEDLHWEGGWQRQLTNQGDL